MLQGYLILEESHVVMITLEAMAEDEEMHSHEIVRCLRQNFVVDFENLLFTKFLAILYHFYKLVVLVFFNCVTFFKDDRAHLSERLL